MANWGGMARTNTVKIADREGLDKALEPFDIEVRDEGEEEVTFFGNSDDGGWPVSTWIETEVPEGSGQFEDVEVEFDFAKHVAPFLAEGETLITLEIGSEKMRCLTGIAGAFQKDKEPVYLDLNNIYDLAATAFGISSEDISPARG